MDASTRRTRAAATVLSTAALLGTYAVSTSSGTSSAAEVVRATAPVASAAPAASPGPPLIPLPPPRNFVSRVDNPYSPFLPGARWVYRGGTPEEPERIVVKVLRRTRMIEGIEATVVRDTVRVGGELKEDTFDWFAQDRRGRVWYLGEATREYEDGRVVSTEGSWETGVDGARAGVVMFRRPRVGTPYRQEYYPTHAEDQARFLALDTRVATRAGVFTRVRMTEDTTPLDPSIAEIKFYARGVGVVLEHDLAPEPGRSELVRYRPAR